MDEKVLEVMNHVLQRQKDIESVKVICEVVALICKQGCRCLRRRKRVHEMEWNDCFKICDYLIHI